MGLDGWSARRDAVRERDTPKKPFATAQRGRSERKLKRIRYSKQSDSKVKPCDTRAVRPLLAVDPVRGL